MKSESKKFPRKHFEKSKTSYTERTECCYSTLKVLALNVGSFVAVKAHNNFSISQGSMQF